MQEKQVALQVQGGFVLPLLEPPDTKIPNLRALAAARLDKFLYSVRSWKKLDTRNE